MSSTAIVEILPPDPADARDDRGRFKEGSPGGPGRPAGQGVGFTRKMRDAIGQSFEMVGGVDYLVMLAYWKPELYTQLVGRALPIKVVGDDEPGIEVVRRVERVVIPRKK